MYFTFRFIFNPSAPTRAPSFITATSKSSTSLMVKWNHLLEGNFQGKAIGYNVTFYPVDSKCFLDFVMVNYTINSTALTNLSVYTMYVINVSAVSSGGTGPANTTMAQTGVRGKR